MRISSLFFGSRSDRRTGLTTERGLQQCDRLMRLVLMIYVPAVAMLYTLQTFWTGFETLLYLLTGGAAVGVSAVCVLRWKLFKGADALLLLFMPVCAWVSAALNFGLSRSSFVSRYYIVWAVLLSLYFVMRVTSEPDKIISLFAVFSTLSLLALCLFTLIHATAALFGEVPGHNLVRGCFQLGRLCGLGNANIFGFSCTALCMLSVYAFLRTSGRKRLIWVFCGIIGWFTLGLTNCRTGIIGVSFSIGLLVFSALLFKAADKRRNWYHILKATVLGVLAGVLCTRFLYLPTILYRTALSSFGSLTHKSHLPANLSNLKTRGVFGNVGTTQDRFITWKRVLEDVRKTPLRTWFGLSLQNSDGVGGVYVGHHEISVPHAHNTYLEMLRRFGVIGFTLLISTVVRWCATGCKCLLSSDRRIPERYLAASAAGILLMGLMEPVPFPYSTVCSLSLPFFAICGYFMNDKR